MLFSIGLAYAAPAARGKAISGAAPIKAIDARDAAGTPYLLPNLDPVWMPFTPIFATLIAFWPNLLYPIIHIYEILIFL